MAFSSINDSRTCIFSLMQTKHWIKKVSCFLSFLYNLFSSATKMLLNLQRAQCNLITEQITHDPFLFSELKLYSATSVVWFLNEWL